MLPDSRRCTKCASEKPLSEFSKAPRGKYGIKASCKACDAARHATLHPPKPRKQPDEAAERARYEERWAQPKRCTKCGEIKDRSEFHKSRDGNHGPILKPRCKVCSTEQALQWFHDNKERNKENKHRWSLAKNYGLTPEDYLAMLESQGGACAICGEAETKEHGRTGTKFRLAVDHCHETGRIRGLLCQVCNRVIGLFQDDTDRHQKAINYLLRRPPEKTE